VKRLISGGAGAITRGSSQSNYTPPQCGLGGPCCGGQACMSDGSLCEQ
jgi:hypothetical protein